MTINKVDRLLNMIGWIVTTREVDTNLVRPQKMKDLLLGLQERRIELLFPPSSNFIRHYYSLGESYPVISNDSQIPLRTEPDLDLYELFPFWIPYDNSEWARKVTNTPDYLATIKIGK